MKRTAACLALIFLFTACGKGGHGIRAHQLDPDTAAEVRRVNVEKYSGDWLVQGTKGSLYISLDENGYYIQERDASDSVTGADFGRIEHRSVGKMLLFSDRSECATSQDGAWLWMDQSQGTVRLRSSRNDDVAIELVAADKRERLRSQPCGTLNQ